MDKNIAQKTKSNKKKVDTVTKFFRTTPILGTLSGCGSLHLGRGFCPATNLFVICSSINLDIKLMGRPAALISHSGSLNLNKSTPSTGINTVIKVITMAPTNKIIYLIILDVAIMF